MKRFGSLRRSKKRKEQDGLASRGQSQSPGPPGNKQTHHYTTYNPTFFSFSACHRSLRCLIVNSSGGATPPPGSPAIERLSLHSRTRSLSSADAGQRLSLPRTKPPIVPSSSPVPPNATSHQVSLRFASPRVERH
ncbi:hypothetical protein NHX12_004097 [Muraenolepis orangiensis]|uniref:Uncharacterized protein n=1 Tax=Muraenolepis orangiensis TaxID=630683 RepID=A0A9Q0IF82_9TELE|nr:hypothetical protein NHX12_004097 [Muraenolepis orangiensis]